MSKTLYELLGVKPGASANEIKEGYLAQLNRLRGGKHGFSADDVENRLKALEDAFSILNDPAQRTIYDFKLKERELEPEVYTTRRPGSTLPWAIVVVCAVLLGLGRYWYVRSEERAQAQRELVMARSQAELEASQTRQAETRGDGNQEYRDRQAKWEEERKKQRAQQELEQIKRDVERTHDAQERQRQAEEQARQYQLQHEDDDRRRMDDQQRWERNRERARLGLRPLPARGNE